MEAFQETRSQVNGKFLPDFSGKPVVMVARVVKVHPNGMSVDVRTTDEIDVNVVLNQPLNEPLEGWVQIRGTGQGRCHILAQHLLHLPNQMMSKFDSELFDNIVTTINACPNSYVNE